MTETIEDVDLTLLINFEEVIPCTYVDDCSDEAEWLVVMPCCGNNIFFCFNHYEQAEIFLEMMIVLKAINQDNVKCMCCGINNDPEDLKTRFVKL